MKLLYESATFAEPLPFKDPYFFARATFSKNVAYWNS